MDKKKLFMYVSQWNLKVGAPGLSLYTFDPETGGVSFYDPNK